MKKLIGIGLIFILFIMSGCSMDETSKSIILNEIRLKDVVSDNFYNGLVTTSKNQYKKGEGESYTLTNQYEGISESEHIVYYINNTDVEIDLIRYYVRGEQLPVNMALYENCSVNETNLEEVNYNNQNRNIKNNTNLTIYESNEVLKEGKQLSNYQAFGSKQDAGETDNVDEGFILDKNKSYCIKATNLNGNDNTLVMHIDWNVLK